MYSGITKRQTIIIAPSLPKWVDWPGPSRHVVPILTRKSALSNERESELRSRRSVAGRTWGEQTQGRSPANGNGHCPLVTVLGKNIFFPGNSGGQAHFSASSFPRVVTNSRRKNEPDPRP